MDDDKDIQRTPRPDEPRLDGGDDPLILVEDGPQLSDVLQDNVLAGVTVRVVPSLRGDENMFLKASFVFLARLSSFRGK